MVHLVTTPVKFDIIHTVMLIVQYLLDMFTSKAQQFLMLELYLYTGSTCFGQLVTIFKSLRALIYNMQHIVYYDTCVAYYI